MNNQSGKSYKLDEKEVHYGKFNNTEGIEAFKSIDEYLEAYKHKNVEFIPPQPLESAQQG